MLDLNGQAKANFDEAMQSLVRTEFGRVVLAALEMDLKRLDAMNRVTGNENKTSAAFYLGRLFENASNAGYKPAYPYVVTQEAPKVVREASWLKRLLTALLGTVR
jgi:hypothetical protein